jgi:hypothetical protein
MASIISAGTTDATSLNVSSDKTGILQLASNNAVTAVTIDASQRVGIGTTSPTSTYRTSIKGDYSSIIGGVEFDNGGGDKMAVSFASATSPSFILSNKSSTGVLRFDTNNTEAMRIQASGALSFGNTTDTGAYNAVLGYRNNHFMGQRSNTMAAGTLTSTMLTLGFELNGAAIVRVVDCGTVVGSNYFTNVYEYFVTCYNGTVTATLKQSQIGSGVGSLITTSTSASTFNVIQQGDASLATWHDTAVDVLGVSAGNGSHRTMTITMAANN